MTKMKIATAQVWVHDQDEALEFYTGKLGWNVQSDVTVPAMGNFRWLAVSPPGQEEVAVVLMAIPGEPVMDAVSREQVETLMSKGFLGGVFLTTDDCQATYEELRDRGVEFIDTPTQQPYGIDAGFRDPSGNHFRITQLADMSQYATEDTAMSSKA
jgi:predicted enzyme related to lactoylglutathione lyase